MLILSIESSCDESAVALLEIIDNIPKTVTHLIATHDHSAYGGVVPESASRQHFYFIPKMIEKLNKEFDLKKIDLVCSTNQPGLIGGLMVGTCAGKALALALDKPFMGVNHIKAHAFSAMIENPTLQFPYICLLVSGGHTLLIELQSATELKILASTRDDAMGELFDKVANHLGLGFPGGKTVEQYALKGNPSKHIFKLPKLKNDLHYSSDDFSFSGLKTSFIRCIDKMENITLQDKYDICASLQDVVSRICIKKLSKYMETSPITQYTIVGGVAANQYIRKYCIELTQTYNKEIFFPSIGLCTDNAVMIGWTGYLNFINGVQPNLEVEVKSTFG